MPAITAFLYLQLLDFLTTLIGFKTGASEASPFVSKLMHATSPFWGVATSKLTGVVIGGMCIRTNRAHLVNWISYWYGAVVLWNCCVILNAGS